MLVQKLEEVTSHDKAEIFLALFAESEKSPEPHGGLIKNSGMQNGKFFCLPKFFRCPSPNVRTPWNSILSKSSMETKPTSIATDTGKHPGDGSGGGSDGGEVDDSNYDNVQYQYEATASERPSIADNHEGPSHVNDQKYEKLSHIEANVDIKPVDMNQFD